MSEYKCDMCGGVYKSGWSDEEAKEEYKQNFGMEVKEGDGIVCDDCYNKMMIEINKGREPTWRDKVEESIWLVGAAGTKVWKDENGIIRTEILTPSETLEWLSKIKNGEVIQDNITIYSPNEETIY